MTRGLSKFQYISLLRANNKKLIVWKNLNHNIGKVWYEAERQGISLRVDDARAFHVTSTAREPYAYQPLRDYTVSLELVHTWLLVVSSTDLCNCHVHDSVTEPAFEWFFLPLWHGGIANVRHVCSDTEKLVPWLSSIGRKCIAVLCTVRGSHSSRSFDILDRYLVIHVEPYV